MNTEEIKAAFEANPSAKQLSITSDEQVFVDAVSASVHQMGLNKIGRYEQKVVVVTRSEFENPAEAKDTEENKGGQAAEEEKGKAAGEETEKPVSMDKKLKVELQKECTERGIEFTEEDTKAMLLDKIEAHDKAKG